MKRHIKVALIFKKTIVASLLVLSVMSWIIYKKTHSSSTPIQSPVVVEVEKVKQGNISIQAHAVGTLVAAKQVQLTPEMAGQVASVLVEDGDFVSQGTPLIQMDAGVNQAKANSAKANLIYSEANYKRMLLLGKKGAVSQQAIDQALANLETKKAIAEETNTLAKKMLIIAPFDGVLGKIKVNAGEYVTIGEPLVLLTDTKNLRLEYNISEKYLAQLKIGQKITFTTSCYPGKLFYGKVAFIAPTINTEDRTVSLYADVPNQNGKLKAGLFANVTHFFGTEKNIVLIPAVSLVATIDGQQVYKVINDKAVAIPVTLGARTENEVQILEGIVPGDTIVVVGQQKIKDGMLIKYKM